jgi:glycosyltransferase involved in cell wall biosynthesis
MGEGHEMRGTNPLEQPVVSVITPSHNGGRFIKQTTLSIKNQTYPKIEHIIVDGGSTDETLDVIRRHVRRYNPHWVVEPASGRASDSSAENT